ncbi:Protein of unknown function [Bizionia echini]|uniref:Outer membrane protein beta-barrel domain-containing protein n=1 Tax=Bizionia echini TaxID=649333 RepID=A0A1I5AS74_9FLAO|nr:DUF3575 domain-containing protein [Bizionia echini]SFN65406.1 Protein of unknown function [Bizionia echini]
MKHLLTSIFLLTFFAVSFQSYAQIDDEYSNLTTNKNEFSLELLQLINGVYQISYERSFFNDFSASLALGYKGKEGLIGFSGIDKPKLTTGDVFYTGFQIIPEIRYYLPQTSKKALTGFYLGAYLKYSNYKSELSGSYTSSGVTYDLEFDMKLDITSIGLMVGYKLPITKHLNIDFMIAGPGSGNYNFKLINKKDLPEEFYDDLNQALEDYSILDFINGDFRFSEVNRRSQFNAFSFRYGIALGYTF